MTMSEWPSQACPSELPAIGHLFRLGRETHGTGVGNLMAFGFGFNKQKVLSAAEKFVQQGKLQNAISEYEKVLKADPKDLTVMNTIGDLYSRSGEHEKAATSFKNVGDAYAGQGFTVKAIAMYKKLSKLKPSTECVLRLAELYTQQGLFNDARAQYLQVAEDFLKSGQVEQAIRIFQKTLEMDPDNVPMRVRLAEAYVRMGKKEDAWQLLTAAAEALRSKGQLAAADELLKRMLKLDPENSYALVLRGRAAAEKGDFNATIQSLSKVPDLDNNPEGLRALCQAYLHTNRIDDAVTLAAKLANVHDDVSAIFECGTAMAEQQRPRDAVQLYEEFADRLLRTDSAKLFESLRALLHYVQDDPETLEKVLAIFQKGGDNSQLTDIYELLAHGYVQSGNLAKGREYYLKLTELEPANQIHANNLQQVTDQLGSADAAHPITPEEGAGMMEELEANAPFIEQRHDDEATMAVKAALTDAELFVSYNMPAKALDPLIAVLPKAPRDLRLNQRLAALHTQAGRFAEAAVCCRTLESIYHDAGYADEASRYCDLAVKYEQRVNPAGRKSHEGAVLSGKTAAAVVQEFEIAAPAPEPFTETAHEQTAGQPAAHDANTASSHAGLFFQEPTPSVQAKAAQEFSIPLAPEPTADTDAAGDWEQDFSIETPQPAGESASATSDAGYEISAATTSEVPPNLDESIEEVRFYIGQGMTEQAEQVLAKLEAIAPGAPELAILRRGIDSAKQMAGSPAMDQAVSLDEPEIDESEGAEAAQAHVQETVQPASVSHVTPQPWPSARPALDDIASEIDLSLDTDVDDAPAHPEPITPPVPPQATKKFSPGTLDEFVADLEASLGNDFIAEPPAPSPSPVAASLADHAPKPVVAVPAPKVAAHSEPVARAAAASVSPAAPLPPAPHTSATPQRFDAASSVDLSRMFGELKQELEHDAATAEEDPETHYNLGVAFREMGLLDEAIGELQKVCQFVDRGHTFPNIMQAYTWLAQCFLEKGLPEVAVRWYEKALKLPGLDQETRTALHYELASSLESAGNNSAALSNFLEVYSSNIDYRDVGERIKALRT
ncbi:MAG: Tetratricopeptide repeat protein [Acidobacteriaceae bacterium]|nr:Tetratricopeptide repeat protein [Acidobacteriaceae bacterium]